MNMMSSLENISMDSVLIGLGAYASLIAVVSVILLALSIIGTWRIYEKAGYSGWKCLIPFYNLYILFEIVYGRGWKFLLLLIPVANVIFAINVSTRLTTCFNKDGAFAYWHLQFAPITLCIMGFGNAEYLGTIDEVIN